MAITQAEKDDVYLTVSIELVKMFDILSNHYARPELREKAHLVAHIEESQRKNWEIFTLLPATAKRVASAVLRDKYSTKGL
ncbi:MAG: hypothetical protein KA746_14135 [Pyrinomonadaceae bacterium]|nr:hypothetical protein [Pyrinomonadaceae bacterium]MBP6211833.1 hypothetical protein [Pyrinomonadaceae bacterium]